MEIWNSMENAPKDGTKILMFVPNEKYPQYSRQYVGKWNDDKYNKKPRPYWDYELMRVTDMRSEPPTHWTPLPEPPKED